MWGFGFFSFKEWILNLCIRRERARREGKERIIGGYLLKVIKTPGLSKNPVDGLGNKLETKIAKILMRSFHNSEKPHVNLCLLMQSYFENTNRVYLINPALNYLIKMTLYILFLLPSF